MTRINKEALHNLVVEQIKNNPHKLCLEEKVIISTGESVIWDGVFYAASPDNLLFLQDHSIVVVEYKVNDFQREKAKEQLKRNAEFLSDYFKMPVKKLYAYGQSNVTTVKKYEEIP